MGPSRVINTRFIFRGVHALEHGVKTTSVPQLVQHHALTHVRNDLHFVAATVAAVAGWPHTLLIQLNDKHGMPTAWRPHPLLKCAPFVTHAPHQCSLFFVPLSQLTTVKHIVRSACVCIMHDISDV
jgi:hypothetical protein